MPTARSLREELKGRAVSALLLSGAFFACNSKLAPSSFTDASWADCHSAAECPGGTCIFRMVDGCNATGTCFPVADANSLPPPPHIPEDDCRYYACGCDGRDVFLGCQTGEWPTPLASPRPCGAGAPCQTDLDCAGDSLICGYSQNDGCSGTPHCHETHDWCGVVSAMACACDGSLVRGRCSGLGDDGYVFAVPVGSGNCTDAGAHG
jgi:hypothetical protein